MGFGAYGGLVRYIVAFLRPWCKEITPRQKSTKQIKDFEIKPPKYSFLSCLVQCEISRCEQHAWKD